MSAAVEEKVFDGLWAIKVSSMSISRFLYGSYLSYGTVNTDLIRLTEDRIKFRDLSDAFWARFQAHYLAQHSMEELVDCLMTAVHPPQSAPQAGNSQPTPAPTLAPAPAPALKTRTGAPKSAASSRTHPCPVCGKEISGGKVTIASQKKIGFQCFDTTFQCYE